MQNTQFLFGGYRLMQVVSIDSAAPRILNNLLAYSQSDGLEATNQANPTLTSNTFVQNEHSGACRIWLIKSQR